jgi:hypothetical protein
MLGQLDALVHSQADPELTFEDGDDRWDGAGRLAGGSLPGNGIKRRIFGKAVGDHSRLQGNHR